MISPGYILLGSRNRFEKTLILMIFLYFDPRESEFEVTISKWTFRENENYRHPMWNPLTHNCIGAHFNKKHPEGVFGKCTNVTSVQILE